MSLVSTKVQICNRSCSIYLWSGQEKGRDSIAAGLLSGQESEMLLSDDQRQSLLIREGALTGIRIVMAQALGIKAGRCTERGLVAEESACS